MSRRFIGLIAGTGSTPTGAAGGDLGGTYPNPTVVSVADVTTGQLPVANGGTGAATFAGNKWFGNNTSSTVAPSASSIGSSDTSVNWYAVDTGAVNAYVVSPTPALVAFATGASVFFKVLNAPTGASTINVSGLGVKNLMKQTTAGVAALSASGDMNTSGIYQAVYDGTEWVLQNPSSSVYTAGALTANGILRGNSNNQLTGSANITSDGTVFTKYNAITTVNKGIPYQVATVDLTAQSATINATNLYLPTATGMFRVSGYLKVTTVGTTSILGGTTGTVITYTDGTDSVAQSVTMLETSQAGAALSVGSGNTGNTTTTVTVLGPTTLYAKTGVQMQYAIGYSSTGTAMQYEVHMIVEAF